MRLNQIFTTGIFVAACGMGLANPALAADMPLYDSPTVPYDEPQQQLEFGTGWYLRGDGAYAQEDHPKFNRALGSFDRNATSGSYAFGVGVGYKLNTFFRFDVTSDYVQPFEYSGSVSCGTGCSISSTDHVWRWNGLANGYVDLGTWYGITPYVGGGAGFSATRQDEQQTLNTLAGTTVANPTSHNDYQFAWAGMAGFSYAFAPRVALDIGYRYIDYGRTTIQLNSVATTQKDLTAQQVRVGVRYTID